MKKISLQLLLLIRLTNIVYAQLPVTDGLVAHWDFEGDDINNQGNVALQGLTLTGGNAPGNSFPANSGGAIFADGRGSNNAVQLTLNACTLSGNSANLSGGGIFSDGSSGGNATLNLSNTILAGNTAPTGPNLQEEDTKGTTTVTVVDDPPSPPSATTVDRPRR